MFNGQNTHLECFYAGHARKTSRKKRAGDVPHKKMDLFMTLSTNEKEKE